MTLSKIKLLPNNCEIKQKKRIAYHTGVERSIDTKKNDCKTENSEYFKDKNREEITKSGQFRNC